MKPNFIPIMFAAGLLLAATPCGWAIPPRQHLVSGVIVGVDRQAHTLAVATGKDAKRLVFSWNDSTHFKHRGHPFATGRWSLASRSRSATGANPDDWCRAKSNCDAISRHAVSREAAAPVTGETKMRTTPGRLAD